MNKKVSYREQIARQNLSMSNSIVHLAASQSFWTLSRPAAPGSVNVMDPTESYLWPMQNLIALCHIILAYVGVSKIWGRWCSASYEVARSCSTLKIMKKSGQRRCKHCALAVARRSQNFSPRRRPLPGTRDGRNLISWIRINPVWWGSMHAILSYQLIVVIDPQTHTHTHTHKPTDKTDYNTLRRSFASAQCKNMPLL